MSRRVKVTPVERLRLCHSDIRRVIEGHRRLTHVTRLVWDEALSALVEKEIPLDTPTCGKCGEAWGGEGCSTIRAMGTLAFREKEVAEQKRRVSELEEALTPRFGVQHLRRHQNQRVELRMYVDEYTLLYGGLPLVAATLKRMHDEWRSWFKSVGDQRRARLDKIWALTIDSDRYVWLTQTFDPRSNAIKRPEAPWDDPEWTSLSSSSVETEMTNKRTLMPRKGETLRDAELRWQAKADPQMAAMAAAGVSKREIAEKFGISKTAVLGALRRHETRRSNSGRGET